MHDALDMIRYANYDVESPYNREAAQWTRTQSQFVLPLDNRPIRDRVARGDRPAAVAPQPLQPEPEAEVVFLDTTQDGDGQIDEEEIVDAELVEVDESPESPFAPSQPSSPLPSAPVPESVEPEDPDIMFIE